MSKFTEQNFFFRYSSHHTLRRLILLWSVNLIFYTVNIVNTDYYEVPTDELHRAYNIIIQVRENYSQSACRSRWYIFTDFLITPEEINYTLIVINDMSIRQFNVVSQLYSIKCVKTNMVMEIICVLMYYTASTR